MTNVIDISTEDAEIVRSVLRRLLPAGARAYVFGSRVHGGARRFSDLDLALVWDRPLGPRLIGEIAEALSESDLPYKVDVLDLASIDPAFRAQIAEGLVPFPMGSGGSP
jgi:uncharacterized protein